MDEVRIGTSWAEVTPIASTDQPDWCNLQWPLTGTIDAGDDYVVYAQVYEADLTNPVGQALGITASIGYSETNTNPDTWTNWVDATYNGDAGNNDEYMANIGAALPAGMYYYASRFQLNGGPYLYGGTAGIWNNDNGSLTVNAVSDVDSYVDATGVTQPGPGTITSLENNIGVGRSIFDFNIVDAGTSDGLPTKVKEITIKAGANNTADWTQDIGGGYLVKNSNITALSIVTPPTVLPGQVTFFIEDGELDVADGGSEIISLLVWTNTTTTDNAVIECMIDANNHGFAADATGSTFAADFGTDVLGNAFTITVTATQFTFETQPSNVIVNEVMSNVVVSITDVNGNVDVDHAGETMQVVFSGTGLMFGTNGSASGNGIYTFTDLSFNTIQTGAYLTAHDINGTLGLSDLQSTTFDVTDVPVIPNVFFSEYIEGGSNNKAVEIFNGTGSDIADLSLYTVKLGSNGGAWGNEWTLSGSLDAGDVYVIANSGSDAAILDVADATDDVTFYNGNDALGLFYNGELIDVIGEYLTDPGTEWDVAGVDGGTLNHTLVRKYPDVTTGNTDWTSSAGTDADDSEWIVYAQDDFTYIGWHGVPSVDTTVNITYPVDGGTVSSTDISATFTVMNFEIPTEGYIEYSYESGTILDHLTTDPISITGLTDGESYTLILELVDPTGNSLSPVVADTVDFTVNVPVLNDVANIAELRAGETDGTVYRLTGEAVLTFQQANRNQKWIEDATGAVLIDDNTGIITTVYNQYDGITNISGTLTLYNGLLEFVPVSDPGAASSTGNTITAQTTDIATLLANVADYESELVYIEDAVFDDSDGSLVFATGTNYALTDATGTFNFRTNFWLADYISTIIPENVNLTGLVGNYNGTAQITSRNLEDIDVISGINELNALGINIYPNPSNGQFNIDVENNFKLEVMDITGKIIDTKVLEGHALIELNNSGIYFLRFSDNNLSHTEKVIVK
jgi:hypothetical protein